MTIIETLEVLDEISRSLRAKVHYKQARKRGTGRAVAALAGLGAFIRGKQRGATKDIRTVTREIAGERNPRQLQALQQRRLTARRRRKPAPMRRTPPRRMRRAA